MSDQGSRVHKSATSPELANECERLRAQLNAIAAFAKQGLQIIAPNGDTLLMNPAGQRIVGYTPEEHNLPWPERTAVSEKIKADGTSFAVEDLPSRRAMRGETVRDVVMGLRRPQGKTVWVLLDAAPIHTAGGEFVGVLLAFSEIAGPSELQT